MLNRIFQRTERGRTTLLEPHDDLAAGDLRLLMRFNGYTPLHLLRDARDDAPDLAAAADRLLAAGLIETARHAGETGPAMPANWGARATLLTASP
ncbi:MAG: hypothetical protein RLZZ592_1422 [Pseudomonadota bacterium]|jgi:DNA-binding MarR family transcriptional regulator|nr:hypothetical protein [Pseudomonadota bacterium]